MILSVHTGPMEVPQRITVRGDEAERPDSVMWFPDDVSLSPA